MHTHGKACAVSFSHPHKCRHTVHANNTTQGENEWSDKTKKSMRVKEIQGLQPEWKVGEPDLLCVCAH